MTIANDITNTCKSIGDKIEDMHSKDVNLDGFKEMLDKALKDPDFDPDIFIDSLLAA